MRLVLPPQIRREKQQMWVGLLKGRLKLQQGSFSGMGGGMGAAPEAIESGEYGGGGGIMEMSGGW